MRTSRHLFFANAFIYSNSVRVALTIVVIQRKSPPKTAKSPLLHLNLFSFISKSLDALFVTFHDNRLHFRALITCGANFINVDCSGGRAASCSEVSLPVFSSLFVTLLLFITFKTLFSYRMYVHASFRVAAVVGRHRSFGLAGRRVCCSVAARLFLC